MEQYLSWRDFTINSIAVKAVNKAIAINIAYNLEIYKNSQIDVDQLIDPHGGLRDLKAKVLRRVSPAFAEDPVRILRLARLAARFSDVSVAPEQPCKPMCSALSSFGGGLLEKHGGPMLFGDFSAADAYLAPVCMRFNTYQLPLPSNITAYVARVTALPSV